MPKTVSIPKPLISNRGSVPWQFPNQFGGPQQIPQGNFNQNNAPTKTWPSP